MIQVGSRDQIASLRFATMVALLAICFLGGGASRLDVISLLVVQPFAVVCIGVFLLSGGPLRWRSITMPLFMLLALALIMVVQLLPLPPALWSALPGRQPLAEIAAAAGVADAWRPMSVSPDLTLGSLVSLSVPAAVLVGFSVLTPEQTRSLLPVLIAGVTVSAILGLAQIAGGGRGPLYFYEITNLGSPVGLFANRNHQAVLLAMVFPMLAVWVGYSRKGGGARAVAVIAAALGVFIIPIVLSIGSRAGLALMLFGLIATLLWRGAYMVLAPDARSRRIVVSVLLVASLGVIVAALLFSRDEAIQRLTGMSVAEEVRLGYLPTVLGIIADFQPLGSGFGSFDPVFRLYEEFDLLSPQFLNHAHNDLLELALTGGVPALSILAWFLVWFSVNTAPLLRRRDRTPSAEFARLGAVIIVMLLLSSVIDYPLRTPLMAALLALACGWLAAHSVEREDGSARS